MTDVDEILKEKDLMLASIQNQEARIITKLVKVEEEIKEFRKLPFCEELGITSRTIQYIDLCNSKELSLNDKMAAYVNCINKLVELIKSGGGGEDNAEEIEMPDDEESEFRQLADLKVAELKMAKEPKVVTAKKSQLTKIITDPYKSRKQQIVDELMEEGS